MAKLASQPVSEPATTIQNSGVPDELRTQYEQALLKHNDARARLVHLQTKDAQQTKPDSVNTISKKSGSAALRQRHLESHLENLRLQKRYKSLRLLSHYSEQADQIASEEGFLNAQGLTTQTTTDANEFDQQTALTATQRHLDALLDHVKARTSDLEIALVKTRQQLKLERNLLDRVQGHSKSDQNGMTSSGSGLVRQRAMEATRDDLQRWIAESLARCEQETTLPALETLASHDIERKQDNQHHEALVETEYEQYLEARLRLVHAAKVLRAPLVEPESEPATNSALIVTTEQKPLSEDTRKRFPMQRAPHLRHKPRMSVNRFGEQADSPALTKIESLLLPEYHHERLLNTHMTYLGGQTTAQDARLLQSLGLLSHESHLLPSYPLSSIDSVQQDRPEKLSQQQSEIEHLLVSWAFASVAAEEVLKETVLGNFEETKEALEQASHHLNEIHIMEDMRRRVGMGQGAPPS